MNEKPFPYIKFRTIKTHRTHADPNGKEEATDWYLNVKGTHNQLSSLENFIKDGHRIIGYGNLEKSQYSTVKNYVQQITGQGVDRRLYEDKPEKPLERKISDEQKRRTP